MIYNPEQILVSEGYCLQSACCLIEINHRELWHFWNSEFQTLAMVSRWEGLLFQDRLPAFIVLEMLDPGAQAGCAVGTGEVKATALGPELPSSP